jgi:hypothetical protein
MITPMARDDPRNPFRSEEDAFRILVVIVAVAVAVIAAAVLVSPTLGAILGAIAIAVGLWRAGAWLAVMLGAPDEDDRPGGRA